MSKLRNNERYSFRTLLPRRGVGTLPGSVYILGVPQSEPSAAIQSLLKLVPEFGQVLQSITLYI